MSMLIALADRAGPLRRWRALRRLHKL